MQVKTSLFLAITIMNILLFGCSADTPAGEAQLSGKLVHKQWEKSAESYCAQGSDYFVLESEADNKVLVYSEKLVPFSGKNVAITATKMERAIICPPGEQCPVPADWKPGTPEPDFKCEIFEVMQISEK